MVSFVFIRTRPKSHYRTGKNSHLLRDAAPTHPTVKPDVLKLARAAEDALTGILWRDVAQIIEEMLVKRFGDHPRCEILVQEMETGAHCPKE